MIIHFQFDLTFQEPGLEAYQLNLNDVLEMIRSQRVKDHQIIHPIDKLRSQMAFQLLEHDFLLLCQFDGAGFGGAFILQR